MDAKLKKIMITPTKFKDDGDVDKEEFATLTFEVPLAESVQREQVAELMSRLQSEWFTLMVQAKQYSLNLKGDVSEFTERPA